MEKRRSKRVPSHLEAMLVSPSLKYNGILQNVSDDGLSILINDEENSFQLINGMLFDVKVTLPSQDTLDLQCEVVWTHKHTALESGNSVSMMIIDPPPKYREFVQTSS
jgi:hypothetical protein